MSQDAYNTLLMDNREYDAYVERCNKYVERLEDVIGNVMWFLNEREEIGDEVEDRMMEMVDGALKMVEWLKLQIASIFHIADELIAQYDEWVNDRQLQNLN